MNQFKHCPVIEVGDVFTRVDRNGKRWTAEVINRTEYFVDVKKMQPYKIKVGDEFGYHYEDPTPTYERCMIHRIYEEIEDGEELAQGIWGLYAKKLLKRVPTAKYVLDCKEEQSAHSRYDRSYSLIKYGDGVERSNEDMEEAFKLFHKYCEE